MATGHHAEGTAEQVRQRYASGSPWRVLHPDAGGTQRLQPGQLVIVDGTAGTVTTRLA
jgi:hypothetical protein